MLVLSCQLVELVKPPYLWEGGREGGREGGMDGRRSNNDDGGGVVDNTSDAVGWDRTRYLGYLEA